MGVTSTNFLSLCLHTSPTSGQTYNTFIILDSCRYILVFARSLTDCPFQMEKTLFMIFLALGTMQILEENENAQ